MLGYKKALALSMIGLALGCAPKVDDDVTKECVVNADQASLFKGRWPTRPVPLAVEANDFTASELNALRAAITTWNNFFTESKGFQLYLSNGQPLSTVSAGGTRVTSATACSANLVSSTGFSNTIKIYKTSASWSYGSQVMALTSLCPVVVSGQAYRYLVAAVMEVNFQDYFAAGKPVPDLQSIITHELGHMLGLDHSCNGSACSSAPDEYREALMYPALGFDGMNGRIKRVVETNDQQRANCLY